MTRECYACGGPVSRSEPGAPCRACVENALAPVPVLRHQIVLPILAGLSIAGAIVVTLFAVL